MQPHRADPGAAAGGWDDIAADLERLPRLCNLMCNFFFVLARVVNGRTGCQEVAFASKSYGPAKDGGDGTP